MDISSTYYHNSNIDRKIVDEEEVNDPQVGAPFFIKHACTICE
jgi:hypothetical protein